MKSATAKSLTHVLAGTEAGPKKLEIAEKNKIPVIDEDGLFTMIRTEKAKSISKKEKEKIEKLAIPKSKQIKAKAVTKQTVPIGRSPGIKKSGSITNSSSSNLVSENKQQQKPLMSSSNSLWTSLYHPSRISDLVGNPTSIKKLKDWLAAWKPDTKKEKAALLSGPPGVGKTSSATIVSRELGYEVIEFNASDTRSKKAIEQHISELLGNKTISTMFSAAPKVSTKNL